MFLPTYEETYMHVSGINIKPYAPLTIKLEHVFVDFVGGTDAIESDFHMFQTSISLAF